MYSLVAIFKMVITVGIRSCSFKLQRKESLVTFPNPHYFHTREQQTKTHINNYRSRNVLGAIKMVITGSCSIYIHIHTHIQVSCINFKIVKIMYIVTTVYYKIKK
jgi:hypothetical protein